MFKSKIDGDLVLHRIVELVHPYLPASSAIPAITPKIVEEQRNWAGEVSINAEGDFVLTYMCYVIQTPHHNILCDTSIGNGKERDRAEFTQRTSKKFMMALAQIGLRPADIDYVVCTQIDNSQIGWHTKMVEGAWAPTFPNATYVLSRAELEHARTSPDLANAWKDTILPVLEHAKVEYVESGYAIADHARAVPTPGPSVGHLSWVFGKDRERLAMAGALLHVPAQVRHPELNFWNDANPSQAAVARRSFLERYCGTETICCTGHFPSPSIGYVSTDGDGFRLNPC